MRSGKTSFWVPLVGALISSILTFIALVTLILNDASIVKALADFINASR
jgi:hypothetical protein